MRTISGTTVIKVQDGGVLGSRSPYRGENTVKEDWSSLGANVHNLVDYKRKNSILVQVTEQSLVSSNNEASSYHRYSRQVSPLIIRVPGGKRVDRFGVQIDKGSK